jgi:hypothetical protein
MAAYATRADLYDSGLPRGTLGSSSRIVASSSAGNDTLELEDHGFETDDEVLVRAVEGGTLSAPLAEGTTYYAIRLTSSTFKLAASPGDSAINLTSNGVSMLVAKELPFDKVLERVSRLADLRMPHLVPLDSPYPEVVIDVVARIAARRLQASSGTVSDTVNAFEEQAWKELERWAKGVPLRDASATASANLAITSADLTADPRGWGSGSLP